MKSTLAFVLFASLLPAQIVFAQSQQGQQPATQSVARGDQDEVVRISTNLVQVDAVVTDKKDQQVTDLQAADFEIYEDDRPQKITGFSYVRLSPPAPAAPYAATKDSTKNAPPAPPPVRLRPDQVRRTIALVVDDLSLSFESTAYVRQALKKFVDEQMQSGDLVAIIRTHAGMGAMQQFTSDKQQLYAAIERVKWFPLGGGGISSFAPLTGEEPLASADDPRLSRDQRERNYSLSRANESLDDFREEIYTVGTLGALNYVVRGLRELPGRKSVVLLSNGISIFQPGNENSRIIEALRRLTDLANRASVVIYTIDARGLPVLGLTAADNTSNLGGPQLAEALLTRRRDYFDSQNGLNYLAQQTGGFFVHDNNDIAGGVRRVLNDQQGYYLIGYRPEENTFDEQGRRRFHKITVKVVRSGLRVRSRTGFYGVTDEEARPVRRTREEQLNAALTSPFAGGDIGVRLTSLFLNDAQHGSVMRAMLFIDASKLTFTDEADGWRKAVLDIVALTFGDEGQVVEQTSQEQTLKVRGETYEAVRRKGLVYTLLVPIKKAGAYQMRMAVRDSATSRIGSATQFIEVPNIAKNKLALSGLVVSGSDPTAANNTTASSAPSAASSPNGETKNEEEISDQKESQATPAVRRFHRGMQLNYGFVIYNARTDKATRRPQLQTQVRVYSDGRAIFTGNQTPLEVSANNPDFKRITAAGSLNLSIKAAPGDYALQVIVTDMLAKGKDRTKAQWIDFEVTSDK